MTKKLHISSSLALPIDALTKSFMVVGQRGTGKTNLGVVMCEEFSAAGLPFVVADPLGVWWGLRSTRDGKGDGLPVYILGGEKGDAPLEPTAGAIVADTIVESARSFVLDLSLMRKGQRLHFMADFCERVFDAKATNRDPLHLMFDECDEFAPQNTRGGEQGGMGPKLLGAVEDLVRRGRSRGLGFTGITQRPASLNKNVLSQADVMSVFRLAAPQDRDALDEWVKSNATKEQLDVFTRELASLPTGHAFVWSPAWLKIFKKVHVRHRETFDSSATPEVGVKAAGPKVMAKVDIAALRERIVATVEAKKAEDPKLLRAKVAALEAQLAQRPEAVATTVEKPVLEQAVADTLRSFLVDLSGLIGEMGDVAEQVESALARVDAQRPIQTLARGATEAVPVTPRLTSKVADAAPPRPAIAQQSGRSATPKQVANLGKLPSALLHVLAARNPKPTTRDQLAILSKYSVDSGSYAAGLATLRSEGLIEHGQPIRITDAGLSAVGPVTPLPTGAELINHWVGALSKSEGTILLTIATARPRILSREQLAEFAGYSAGSGSYAAALAKLRTLELIDRRELRLSAAFEES